MSVLFGNATEAVALVHAKLGGDVRRGIGKGNACSGSRDHPWYASARWRIAVTLTVRLVSSIL
jgi:hypothetical protein